MDSTIPAALQQLVRESLSTSPQTLPPPMEVALRANFGDAKRWLADLLALAAGQDRGGLVLCMRPADGRLFNARVHDDEPLPGVPLLALALPGDAASRIDWPSVHARYQAAVEAASEGLGVDPGQVGSARVVDVRRDAAFRESGAMLPTAQWRDPAHIGDWAPQLPPGQSVVVYCVHGQDIGRAAALRLRAAGVEARFLIGGFEAWREQRLPTVPASGV